MNFLPPFRRQMITFATMKRMYSIALMLVCGIMAANAQNIAKKNDSSVEPLEPQRLQGPREATEAEKEYARQYEKDKQEQAQIDYNLPSVDENGQVVTPAEDYYYPFYGGWGWNRWRLHKGLNVNLSASAFVTSGKGWGTHGGLTQDISLMYVTNLSKKATLAIGGYFNNMEYRGDNYTTAGFSALFGYRFNEHWSAYAFAQKAFTSNNFGPAFGGYYPYRGYYGPAYWDATYGYAGASLGPWNNRFMDRIGGGVTYQWGEYGQNSISFQVEYDHMPNQSCGYDYRRYDYPVR